MIHSPRLEHLHRSIQAGDAAALSQFWMEMEARRIPLIEADGDDYAWVTFLWRDDGVVDNVAVIQDWGGDGIREHHMARLPDSDLWYYTRRLPSDTRTTYQLSPVHPWIPANLLLINLILSTRRSIQLAALLVDNLDRSELLCQPEFSTYITDQVLPWLRGSYPVTNDPRLNIVVRSSYGGLAAAFMGFEYPEVWGTVLSQTGWFRWHPEDDPEHHWLPRQFSRAPRLPLRFWLQVGKLEIAQMLDGGPSQLAANQYFRDVLIDKDYPVSYDEYSGGHDMSSLEFPLAKALREIFQ